MLGIIGVFLWYFFLVFVFDYTYAKLCTNSKNLHKLQIYLNFFVCIIDYIKREKEYYFENCCQKANLVHTQFCWDLSQPKFYFIYFIFFMKRNGYLFGSLLFLLPNLGFFSSNFRFSCCTLGNRTHILRHPFLPIHFTFCF